MNALIACRVLTRFTVRSHEFPEEGVDFAIWSREHGILVDNTDEEKAKQVWEAALEVQERRLEEECQSEKAGSRKVDTLQRLCGPLDHVESDSWRV